MARSSKVNRDKAIAALNAGGVLICRTNTFSGSPYAVVKSGPWDDGLTLSGQDATILINDHRLRLASVDGGNWFYVKELAKGKDVKP